MNSRDTPPARRRRLLPLVLLAVAGLLLAVQLLLGAGRRPHAFHGTAWDPPQEAADFELVDHRGTPTRLSDHRGRTVLLFFGFVNCPDVCPLTLTRLANALEELGADTSRVRVLLVTVDPAHDTPDALAGYVSRFGPHVVGLTGDSASLAAVRTSFHAHAARQSDASPSAEANPDHGGHGSPGGAPAAAPTFSHTTQVFGIDREGMIRVLISPEFAPRTIREDIRTLLRM